MVGTSTIGIDNQYKHLVTTFLLVFGQYAQWIWMNYLCKIEDIHILNKFALNVITNEKFRCISNLLNKLNCNWIENMVLMILNRSFFNMKYLFVNPNFYYVMFTSHTFIIKCFIVKNIFLIQQMSLCVKLIIFKQSQWQKFGSWECIQ